LSNIFSDYRYLLMDKLRLDKEVLQYASAVQA
jgi:hypothetical protein